MLQARWRKMDTFQGLSMDIRAKGVACSRGEQSFRAFHAGWHPRPCGVSIICSQYPCCLPPPPPFIFMSKIIILAVFRQKQNARFWEPANITDQV